MDTLENLNRKLEGAKDIKSVVKAMKAMAASNISQYEAAVASLGDYNHTVTLGIKAYLISEKVKKMAQKPISSTSKSHQVCAIVFGSDLGLVGQFNDLIADYLQQSFPASTSNLEVWVIGERVQGLLSVAGYNITKSHPVPSSIDAITPLVQSILLEIESANKNKQVKEFYIIHNRPKGGSGYQAVMQRLLPLDEKWMDNLMATKWPSNNIPEVVGSPKNALNALINAYLFVSVFRACAESLAAENASRLQAMQRAEKSISDTLENLNKKFQSLRQSMIDEELFDVVSGFEALKQS
ncbi:F0F1 ATP synthase subunit gamma [Pedobacter arcticus]|uniref:F0F1 ATP synthase subunit gamma n=1 Tax=Pedobacter arcticus TaxID=752140 RepID=UPI00031661DE|nr:F0F1 ATP synthase subunit gamma [Pedobacter arcticus]